MALHGGPSSSRGRNDRRTQARRWGGRIRIPSRGEPLRGGHARHRRERRRQGARPGQVQGLAGVRIKTLPPTEFLRECLDYNPTTGELRWKVRPPEHFPNKKAWATWNARWSGKGAFNAPHKKGYRYGTLTWGGKSNHHLAHRVIWKLVTGEDPVGDVDHWNLNKANNRWSNLRDATGTNNQANSPRQS
ncbi:HNH endonuclease [Mesorhizobium sp. B2-4-1]|nr:HNH endonuclease [Mesorhizobium sp. B2-4-1]